MKAVIVLITFFQVSTVLCEDAPSAQAIRRLLPWRAHFPTPGSPLLPLPSQQSCGCSGGPACGSQCPPSSQLEPSSTASCSCCKPPTGTLALLLDIVANHMNLPKGSLSRLPLCSARDVQLPPQLLALTMPLSSLSGSSPQNKQLTIPQIEALIRLLKTPQAVAQTFTSPPNPCTYSPPLNSNCIKKYLNLPRQTPYFPPQSPVYPSTPQCVTTNQLSPSVQPVNDGCSQRIPVYRNTIRHEEQQTIRNVPVVEKTITNQVEQIVRQVPVIRKCCRPVIETRTRHIPIIRKRIRTVVEPYTSHVPVLEKYAHPVEDTFITTVPVVERRYRPVLTQRVRHVPVMQQRLRPVVQSQISQVPVRQRIFRQFIEHRVKPYLSPCDTCNAPCQSQFTFPPTFLNVPGTPSFPCRQ